MPRQNGVDELRDDGVVVADDAGEQRLAGLQLRTRLSRISCLTGRGLRPDAVAARRAYEWWPPWSDYIRITLKHRGASFLTRGVRWYSPIAEAQRSPPEYASRIRTRRGLSGPTGSSMMYARRAMGYVVVHHDRDARIVRRRLRGPLSGPHSRTSLRVRTCRRLRKVLRTAATCGGSSDQATRSRCSAGWWSRNSARADAVDRACIGGGSAARCCRRCAPRNRRPPPAQPSKRCGSRSIAPGCAGR